MGSWKPTHPARKYREPVGPVSTIGQLARESSWLWAHCPGKCQNWAAIPMAPMVARFGPDASSVRLRAALRCTKCGRKGCLIQHPSWGMGERGYGGGPPLDQIPLALRRWMAKDALRSIGVEIRS
jgi:hypothetical protein